MWAKNKEKKLWFSEDLIKKNLSNLKPAKTRRTQDLKKRKLKGISDKVMR